MLTRKTKLSALALTLCSTGLILWHYSTNSAAPVTADTRSPSTIDSIAPAVADNSTAANMAAPQTSADPRKILSAQLHTHWDSKLANPYARLKMIDDLKKRFQAQYGENWREELIAFLKEEFPQWPDLEKKLLALEDYNQWMEDLKPKMQFSSAHDRNQAIWAKRVELFGEDAYKIWEAALKSEQMHEKLAEVDSSADTFSEKSAQYIENMKSIYGEQVIAPNQPHATQMMAQFLQLQSVQKELQALPAEQQTQQLREFRSAMGMDAQALQRWDALDQERAAFRTKGNQYMEQRERLSSQFEGDQLNNKLAALRSSLFTPEEADILSKEESSGYYRFSMPQIIGQN